jgi:hypothetical protein
LDELAITQAEVRAIHMTLNDVVTLRDRLEILKRRWLGYAREALTSLWREWKRVSTRRWNLRRCWTR